MRAPYNICESETTKSDSHRQRTFRGYIISVAFELGVALDQIESN